MKNRPGVPISLAIALVAAGSAAAAPDEEATGRVYDCGTLSLYALLRVEGRTATLVDLERRLPPVGPTGLSLAQLQETAKQFGLRLDGRQFAPGAAPREPAILYLGQPDHGHFVVSRPVGHSGKLVQVLDPNGDPLVIDADRLGPLLGWRGVALIGERRSKRTPFAVAVLGLALAMVGIALGRRVRRAHEPESGDASALVIA